MKRAVWMLLWLVAVSAWAQRPVYSIKFEEIVTRATADYVVRAHTEAVEKGAECFIMLLDTPGGEMEAMKRIVQLFLNSPIPVVVYVSPSGSRAGSAGVFITMAGHVAAMAPGTRIGAAHPVSGDGKDIEGEMAKKVTNDAVAFARSIAEQRGRNKEWAELAVSESKVLSEKDATSKKVVDLIAVDMQDLLGQIDGKTVKLASGTEIALSTKGKQPIDIPKTTAEAFLIFIATPAVFYVLILLMFYGLIGELQNPGATLPGVVGVISLLLALYAWSVLPVNVLGILLIVLAFALVIIDLFAATHGVLTAGAIASFVMGSVLLFRTDSPAFRLSMWLIAVMTVLTFGLMTIALMAAWRSQKRKKESGKEGIIGKTAVVKAKLDPVGQVFVESALWTAETKDPPIDVGESVVVEAVSGLKLYVRRPIAEDMAADTA